MKVLLRIVLLAVMVVLGFTAVFPEWLDLKDALIAERQQEELDLERMEQDRAARQRLEEERAALKALQPQAQEFAHSLWSQVEGGNYGALYDRGTSRFQTKRSAEDLDRLKAIYGALGGELRPDQAMTKPGYNAAMLSRSFTSGDLTLMSESRRWSEKGLLVRTLELKRENERLTVDAAVLEVYAYPDAAQALPQGIRRTHAFR